MSALLWCDTVIFIHVVYILIVTCTYLIAYLWMYSVLVIIILEAKTNALVFICVVGEGGGRGSLKCIAHSTQVQYDGQCTVLLGVYTMCSV